MWLFPLGLAQFILRIPMKRSLSMLDASNLAYIARVTDLHPIHGREDCELAEVKGWKCIVEKGHFSVNDLAVYYSIGSIPDPVTGKIRTITMGDVISQGVLRPMSCLQEFGYQDLSKYKEGDNVEEEMGVQKHIDEEERHLYPKSGKHGTFPTFIPKTDAPRIQHDPTVYLAAIQDKDIVITRKEDGTSCTFLYNHGNITVCSRNHGYQVGDTPPSPDYFKIFKQYDLEKKLKSLNRNIAIQGEIVGPKINSNRMKLTQSDFFVFDIYDVDKEEYMSYDAMCSLCTELGLFTVPLIYRGPAAALTLSLDGLMQLAESAEYAPGVAAEGIVVNSDDPAWRKRRVHFKVISNKYLLQHKL